MQCRKGQSTPSAFYLVSCAISAFEEEVHGGLGGQGCLKRSGKVEVGCRDGQGAAGLSSSEEKRCQRLILRAAAASTHLHELDKMPQA